MREDDLEGAVGFGRWRGCLPSLVVVALAVVVLVAVGVGGGFDDEGDGTADGDAAENPALPHAVTRFDVTASTGETFATTFHPAPTNTDKVLVAAPSRNVDEDSLDPLIDELGRRDCASVITFNARLLSQTSPFDAYLAVLAALADVYGFVGSDRATLGASFTGLDAVRAAESGSAMYAFVLSPSQENPTEPPDDVMVQLLGASRDTGFVSIYDQWADLGYDAFEFDSDKHGTAMFQNGVSDQVVNQIADTFCG